MASAGYAMSNDLLRWLREALSGWLALLNFIFFDMEYVFVCEYQSSRCGVALTSVERLETPTSHRPR
jgi:hypothetical protein